jgi:hypothetical protein
MYIVYYCVYEKKMLLKKGSLIQRNISNLLVEEIADIRDEFRERSSLNIVIKSCIYVQQEQCL